MSRPQEGQPAPGFTAKDQNGAPHSLKEYRGRHVVLAFIPDSGDQEDAKEIQGFAKALNQFQELGAEIVAVGTADEGSHRRIAKQAGARFSLLTDKGLSIASNYGCAKNGHALRNTFLIDPEGRIEKVYDSVFAGSHPKEVLHQIQQYTRKDNDGHDAAS